MERKRHIRYIVLTIMAMLFFGNACTLNDAMENKSSLKQEVTLRLSGAGFSCKSTDPDEFRVTDISLMVFDEYGNMDKYLWLE